METGEATTLTASPQTVGLTTTISTTSGLPGGFALSVYLTEAVPDPPTSEPVPIGSEIEFAPDNTDLLNQDVAAGTALVVTGNANIALLSTAADCESVNFVCIKFSHSGSDYSKCYAAVKNCGKL